MAFTKAGRYDQPLLRNPTDNSHLRAVLSADVHVFESDGTTAATLYADPDKTGGAAADNVVSPDSEGNLEFFANPGTYVIKIYVDDVLERTDTVIVPPDPDELEGDDRINVTDFDATGDGSTDDLAAFDAMIAAMSAGDEGYVPDGTYLLEGKWTISKAVTIQFAPGAKLLSGWTTPASVSDPIVAVTAAATIRQMTLDGANRAHRGVTVSASGAELIEPTVQNVGGGGIVVDTADDVTITHPYVHTTMASGDTQAAAIKFDTCREGLLIGGHVHDAYGKGVSFTDSSKCRVIGTVVHNTLIDGGESFYGGTGCSSIKFIAVTSLDPQGSGIKLSRGCTDTSIDRNSVIRKSRGVGFCAFIQGASRCVISADVAYLGAYAGQAEVVAVDDHPTTLDPAEDNVISVLATNPDAIAGLTAVASFTGPQRTRVVGCIIVGGFAIGVTNYGANTVIANNPRIDATLEIDNRHPTTQIDYLNNGRAEFATKVLAKGEVEVDGALNHDGSTAGFFGVAPAARPGATDDIKDALTTLGLLQGTSATPLNLDGGALSAGVTDISGTLNVNIGGSNELTVGANTIVMRSTAGVERLRSNSTGLGFFGATPVAKPAATDDIKDSLVALGLITGAGATPLDLDGGALTVGSLTAAGTVVIGDAPADTIGFHGATPVAQQAQTVDLKDALVAIGLMSSTPGATPLNLDGGDLTAATLTTTGNVTVGGATVALPAPGRLTFGGTQTIHGSGTVMTFGSVSWTTVLQGFQTEIRDNSANKIIEIGSTDLTIGFFGVAPVAQPAAYTPANVTTDRSYDADATTIDELADVVGTLVADLQSLGLIG